ncbi:MAG: 3-oxoacyl-ACP reductase FabG [Pseudomonadota bacterium]
MSVPEDRRVALVTGASRGIGAAIAAHLAAEGWYVVGTATAAAGVERIGTMLDGKGEGAVLDSSVPDSVDALFKAMTAGPGAPAAVVNNAGMTRDNLLLRLDVEDMDAVLQANLVLAMRVAKAALRPMMKARFGRIVNLSSVVARNGNPGQSNYAASKAGLEGFTRALALEVASRNITVNAVAPGFIETDMTGALNDDQQQQLLDRIPLARMGSAAEVAAAVAFLLGEGAAYITGETLHVNGGLRLD